MGHKVGLKGQVVIQKELRDKLGVEAGWDTVQRAVDNHLEIHFVPPEHNRSLAGTLSRYVRTSVPDEESFNDAADRAWRAAAWERVDGWTEEVPS
ncbi:MAG: AbrB/MazE/SpoVT family DNA-binding domain-containing protein [SAR202 cluster bacterium]|nr:AbrB/MazE/SpoVT family DNA-binding domain-containing protein [SAR202 cluster bacterium]